MNGLLPRVQALLDRFIGRLPTVSPASTDLLPLMKASGKKHGKATVADVVAASGVGYTDEEAQDAVGGILADGTTVDFTYDDGTPQITAEVKDDSISNAKLANMATARIKGRDTAGTGDPEDLTLTEVLDLVGSAAQGDILYRNASDWARLAKGTAAQYLRMNSGATAPEWATLSAGNINLQEFSSPGGTWTKPANAKAVLVIGFGCGGSGGGGQGGAAGTNRTGGGAGGGAARVDQWLDPDNLGSTETVTIPTASAGGSGGSSGAGGAGSVGGNVTFGSHVTAYGGGPSDGGSAGAHSRGGGGGGLLSAGAINGVGGNPTVAFSGDGELGPGGGDSNATGGGRGAIFGGGGGAWSASTSAAASPGGKSIYGAGGGGGGGSMSSTNTYRASAEGGEVGNWNTGSGTGGGGGAAGATGGGAGGAGTAGSGFQGGEGGGGGGANTGGTGGVGGAGGTPGGGGGGGGAGTTTGGDGGIGGDGYMWVITFIGA